MLHQERQIWLQRHRCQCHRRHQTKWMIVIRRCKQAPVLNWSVDNSSKWRPVTPIWHILARAPMEWWCKLFIKLFLLLLSFSFKSSLEMIDLGLSQNKIYFLVFVNCTSVVFCEFGFFPYDRLNLHANVFFLF